MTIWFDIAEGLSELILELTENIEGFEDGFTPDVRTADPRFGDYQANGVLPYAKSQRTNPRALGEKLVAALKECPELDLELIEISIAGPGFINFTLKPAFLFQWIATYRSPEQIAKAASELHKGQKIVVDYGSPNTAKQLHVGHLRTLVIGEAIRRMLAFAGATVTGDNHIGDWGTGFGMLIMAIKRKGYDLDNPGENALDELEQLYKWGSAEAKESEESLAEARAELVKLQAGDPENVGIWEAINTISSNAFQSLYDRLGVQFDYELGESFYRDKVDRVYEELGEAGISTLSEGAQVVFHPEHPRFKEQPFIIRKSDGASNYASTDLATALYRLEAFNADEIVYVTDGRQRDHFEQLFLTVEKWFKAREYKLPKLHHVWFGTILGEDGKAIKTRSGDPIRLKALLDEARDRSYAIVDEKNADLPEDEKQNIAEVVGVSAIRYADLMQNRTNDYTFSWQKLLSMDGNTAPYMLYAVARIKSIFRKAEVAIDDALTSAAPLETDTEIALARKLSAFPITLDMAISDLRPHHLCTYLFELTGVFSSFYNADKVNVEDTAIKARRLMLCQRTLTILETGLSLLGIPTLERM